MSNLNKGKVKKWRCMICGEIVEGVNPPDVCPVCGVESDKFVEVKEEVTFESDKADNIVILGGGAAGFSAAEAIRERNKKCSVEIISDEEVFCYNRPMLTKGLIADFDADRFFTKQLDWYEKNNVKFTLGKKAESIDLSGKTLKLADGSTREYDKLIYATGAESNRIPVKGADKEGVFVIRKLADANIIREKMDAVENVVVIGGGILGIEAAWEFTRAGKNVTVLDIGPRIMGRQLDEDASDLLKDHMEEAGTDVLTSIAIDEISGEKVATGVKIKDGELIPAEMVIISAGIKTNSALGTEAGLKGDRFIEVDEHMMTSDENVYACGDVAAFNGVSVGIWSQADAMGKVAGACAAGDTVSYEPVTPSTSFIGFDTDIFSVGDTGNDPEGNYQVKEIGDMVKVYKKLYFTDGKLCGGILIGETDKTLELLNAYENKTDINDPAIDDILGMF